MTYRMRCLSLGVVMFALFGGVPRALAQTVAAGPYYAMPSWDQQLPCPTLANCQRFVVLANWNSQAVLDRETGLVWERAPGTTFPFTGPQEWDNAIGACRQISTGHRLGWRLPTIQELQSLVDPDTPTRTLPPGHPFLNIQTGEFQVYWSSTRVMFNGTLEPFAYIVGFNGRSGSDSFANTNFVWCVRGGAGVEPM